MLPAWKFVRLIRKPYRAVLYRVHPKFRHHVVATGLKPGPHSGRQLILHANFQILLQSIDFEFGSIHALEQLRAKLMEKPDPKAPDGLIDHHLERQSALLELSTWWVSTRPTQLERLKALSDKVIEQTPSQLDNTTTSDDLFDIGPINEEILKEYETLRRELTRQEQTMLHRLIDLRLGLD